MCRLEAIGISTAQAWRSVHVPRAVVSIAHKTSRGSGRGAGCHDWRGCGWAFGVCYGVTQSKSIGGCSLLVLCGKLFGDGTGHRSDLTGDCARVHVKVRGGNDKEIAFEVLKKSC